jgi:molecular chaperone DnaJ
MFKKVAEAYDTLSDGQKKQQYDYQRNNPNAGMGGFGFGGGIDPWEIFERMTGGFSGGNRGRRNPDKGLVVNISIFDSYLGNTKKVDYMRKVKCNPCDGKGGERTTCPNCSGRGSFQQRMGNGMFTQIINTPCPSCKGQGSILVRPCASCSGTGTKDQQDSISFNIPVGIDQGQMLRVSGMGDFSNGGYGDVVLQMNLIPDNNFEKEGNNLIYTAILNLEDLKKETIDIPHPNGNLNIKMPQEFDTNVPLRVKNKGFTMSQIGDLYVRLRVKFTRTS